ncbi:MAG: hypothetical protein WCO82_03440 [Sphingomonadales bacterium]|jgi:hypothetical protein
MLAMGGLHGAHGPASMACPPPKRQCLAGVTILAAQIGQGDETAGG